MTWLLRQGEASMKVAIKSFDVEMNIKSNGIELEVRSPQNKHLGDLYVTMTQLIWCKGRTTRAKGVAVEWPEFIRGMESKD